MKSSTALAALALTATLATFAEVFQKYLANRDEVLRVASDKWPSIRTTQISDL
jgi:hypothetical protein